MIRPSLRAELEKAVTEYEQIPGFPLGMCTLSQDLAVRTQTNFVQGSWIGPKKGAYRGALLEAGLRIPDLAHHCMVQDPESRCYLDISARQFMPELDRILILDPTDPRIKTIGDPSSPEQLYIVTMITPPPKKPITTTVHGLHVYAW